jgi:tRNA(fMet)-specific endonuclease VapC
VVILDTEAMTVWVDPRQTDRDRLKQRLARPDATPWATTVVCLQEQMSGWFGTINRARKAEEILDGYAHLLNAFDVYRTVTVLPFDAAAQARFEDFRRQKLRVSTMDLRIASVALVYNATLLTRNIRDFRRVPGLAVEDWAK